MEEFNIYIFLCMEKLWLVRAYSLPEAFDELACTLFNTRTVMSLNVASQISRESEYQIISDYLESRTVNEITLHTSKQPT